MEKTLIYYHRAYRKVTGSGWMSLFVLLATALPLSLLILFLYPFLTDVMSVFTQEILSRYYPSGTIGIIREGFLTGDVSYVSIPGKNPSNLVIIVNLIISLGMIIIMPKVKKGKNIAIFFFFLAVINFTSAMFFAFSSSEFPYTATQFSELYMKTEISMWLFMPFILGMAIMLLPSPYLTKLVIILLTLVYSFIFGLFRYIIFLYILSNFSVIYMALLYFSFGPLIDFVYIVGIYCFFTSKLADKLRSSETVWKWSY